MEWRRRFTAAGRLLGVNVSVDSLVFRAQRGGVVSYVGIGPVRSGVLLVIEFRAKFLEPIGQAACRRFEGIGLETV